MIYVTSDVHGKFDSLKKLLKAANFSDDDWLWIIGDVIDRNADGGVELLKWLLLRPNVQLILGNHESVLLANRRLFCEINEESIEEFGREDVELLSVWRSNGGDVTIESLSKETPDMRRDILDYLEDCPLYEIEQVDGRKYVLVHGGLGNFARGKELSDYTADELLWERPSLSTVYSPEKYTVIVGHTPTIFYSSQYKNRMIKTESFWNIDTGAATGEGNPMLLCLDNLREYYITDGEVEILDGVARKPVK